jgi:hypothetical protein
MMVKENRRRKRKARKSKYYAWAYEEKPRKKSGTFKPPVLQQFQIAGDTQVTGHGRFQGFESLERVETVGR